MTESFWLRNMVVFGQGAPNKIKKIGSRQGRCLSVWSEEKGFCRIYPVPYGYVHDWEIVDFEGRLPTNDGRENSFVIFNYEQEWENLSKRIIVHKEKNRLGNIVKKSLKRDQWIELTRKLANDSFSEVRDNKKSFGLIKPSHFKLELKKNQEKSEGQTLLTDPDAIIMNQNDYAWLPSVEYSCFKNCKSKHPRHSKLVEWGAYQWMMKDPNNNEHCIKLVENYHVDEANYEHYLLIGNIRTYPKTYVVVKIIRFKVK